MMQLACRLAAMLLLLAGVTQATTTTQGNPECLDDETDLCEDVVITSTAEDVPAGATALKLADVAGLSAGMSLTITNSSGDTITNISETKIIVSVTPDSSRRLASRRLLVSGTVTLDSPLQYSYTQGASVAVAPQAVEPMPDSEDTTMATTPSPGPPPPAPPPGPPASPVIRSGTFKITLDADTPKEMIEAAVEEAWLSTLWNSGFNPGFGSPLSKDAVRMFITSVTASGTAPDWSVSWTLTVPGAPAALAASLDLSIGAAQADLVTFALVIQGVFQAMGNLPAAGSLKLVSFGVDTLYEATGFAVSQLKGRLSIVLVSLLCIFVSTQAR